MHFWTFLLLTVTTLALGQNPEEPDSLEAVVMRLTTELNEVKAQQAADVNRLDTKLQNMQGNFGSARSHVAFFAQFSPNKLTSPATGTFTFDHVIFDDAQSYDATQGVFTAPLSGVYIFSVKVFTGEHESVRPAVDLVHNGAVVDRLAFDYLSNQPGHGGNSHSMTTVLRLHEGDRVQVAAVQGYVANELYGGFHTSFSGALLYAD